MKRFILWVLFIITIALAIGFTVSKIEDMLRGSFTVNMAIALTLTFVALTAFCAFTTALFLSTRREL